MTHEKVMRAEGGDTANYTGKQFVPHAVPDDAK